jgi:hypothetical protein
MFSINGFPKFEGYNQKCDVKMLSTKDNSFARNSQQLQNRIYQLQKSNRFMKFSLIAMTATTVFFWYKGKEEIDSSRHNYLYRTKTEEIDRLITIFGPSS